VYVISVFFYYLFASKYTRVYEELQVTIMTKFLATVKAILTRLVFASHAFIAIWQVTTFKKNPFFWYLSGPIVLLFFEGIFTLTIKESQEWKWYVNYRCRAIFQKYYLYEKNEICFLLYKTKAKKKVKIS